MTCTNCEQARTQKHWAIFQADCHGCKVRALAGSPTFFDSIQANALIEAFGSEHSVSFKAYGDQD